MDHPAPPWWPSEPERRDLNKRVPGNPIGRVIEPDANVDPNMEEMNPYPATPEERERERERLRKRRREGRRGADGRI